MNAARAKKKVAPAPRKATHQLAKATADSSLYRAEDGYAPPTAEDRREAELLAELAALGYTVAVACVACGHALTHPKSIARGHLGPKCAAKAVAQ